MSVLGRDQTSRGFWTLAALRSGPAPRPLT